MAPIPLLLLGSVLFYSSMFFTNLDHSFQEIPNAVKVVGHSSRYLNNADKKITKAKPQWLIVILWWARPDSNRQPKDYESPAPPLSYRPLKVSAKHFIEQEDTLQNTLRKLSLLILTPAVLYPISSTLWEIHGRFIYQLLHSYLKWPSVTSTIQLTTPSP